MSKRSIALAIVVTMIISAAAMSWAAPKAVKTYQVTGPVLSITDGKIVVDKDGDKWEIELDKDTKVTGDLKVGSKVTIQYTMYATAVTVKEAVKDVVKDAAKTDTKAGAR